jgi:hypothetical protein
MSPDISEIEQDTFSRFSAPVARELVHRRAVSEVFLTGVQATGSETYIVSAQWPRWHVFYGSPGNVFDSALVVETLRQLTVFIAHSHMGVPLSMQFLMPDMSVSMVDGAIRDSSQPAEVTAEVRVSDVRKTVRGIAAFRTTATFMVDGQSIANGRAGARIVDLAAYNRIRSRRGVGDERGHVVPLEAQSVGHASSWNVVLGKSADESYWPLRVDVSNPILFDHPLDHVPGVLLIEAARQALRVALVDPTLDFASFSAQFVSIAELQDETEVVLEELTWSPGAITAVVSVRASGTVLMSVVAEVTPGQQPPEHPPWKDLVRPDPKGYRDPDETPRA